MKTNPSLDLFSLDSELRAKKVRPCYLIFGKEEGLIFCAKKRILTTLFLKSSPSVDAFEAGKQPFAVILDALKTPSLFESQRSVVISNADRLKKEEWELLSSFFAKPSPNVVVILLMQNPPKKSSSLPSSACVVECRPLYPRQIPSWINMEARELKILLSKEAALCIAEYVGDDLENLRQALEKLSLYVGEARMIQPEDVEAVLAKTTQKDIFEFTKAVGQKNSAQAILLLHHLLDQGEEPLRILGMIARQMRLLSKAQDLMQTQADEALVAKTLRVHPFFVKDYLGQAKGWQGDWLECFKALYACDHRLKSSRHKPRVLLEKLLRGLTFKQPVC